MRIKPAAPPQEGEQGPREGNEGRYRAMPEVSGDVLKHDLKTRVVGDSFRLDVAEVKGGRLVIERRG